MPGEVYSPQVIRVINRAGEESRSEEPTIRGHMGLAFEAAHFATMVAEGRTESDLMPLEDTVAVLETMDEMRHQVGVSLPGE